MEDFLNKLYSYENFSLYLIIAIVVLVILFIIILLFGKKDKKEREIEATKKLEQLNIEDGFKETTESVQVEVSPNEKTVNEDTIVIPTINELPKEEVVIEEPKVEIEEPVVEEVKSVEETKENLENTIVNIPVFENEKEFSFNTLERPEVNITENTEVTPILNESDSSPLFVEEENKELEVSTFEDDSKVNEEIKLPEFNEPELPVFDFDSAMNDVEKEIDLPKEEEVIPIFEEKKEEKVNNEVFSSVFVPEKKAKEEEEIELPTLKKNVEKEVKDEIQDFHLDDITGEIYKINK